MRGTDGEGTAGEEVRRRRIALKEIGAASTEPPEDGESSLHRWALERLAVTAGEEWDRWNEPNTELGEEAGQRGHK